MATAKDVDEYLAGLPAESRIALEHLRQTIRRVVPGATESISYGMPTMRYRGKPLFHFSAWKNHCALYGQASSLMTADELERFETAKGTVRFTPAEPLPDQLVIRLAKARVAEIDGA